MVASRFWPGRGCYNDSLRCSLSLRPGRIAEIVHVDLPRPRTLDMMTTPKFGEIVDHIRGMLDKGEDM